MLDQGEIRVLRETTEVKITYAGASSSSNQPPSSEQPKPALYKADHSDSLNLTSQKQFDYMSSLNNREISGKNHREFENLLGMINDTKKELKLTASDDHYNGDLLPGES
jgi:hypothetical protein